MNELTHLDLFSGIGGFSLAAERAGFRTVGFAEVEPFASAVLRKHWPAVPNLGDVRAIDGKLWGGVTLLSGGFPCQPFSEAGHQRGEDDDRHLWPAMLNVVSGARPAWVVGENVSGLLDVGIDRVLADLEGLGYAVQTFAIPACAAGLAQIEGFRCWIVATSDGVRLDQMQEAGRVARPSFAETAKLKEGWSIGRFRGNSGRIWPAPVAAFDRVDYGIPGELDRLRCLGNAISPQAVFPILDAIARIERGEIAL